MIRGRGYINVTWSRLSTLLDTVRKKDWIHARKHPFEIWRSHWAEREETMKLVDKKLVELEDIFCMSATIPVQ